MSSMILGGCIPSPKKQTEAITVEENPNMMYMLVGSYATPEEEGIKVYNFDEQKWQLTIYQRNKRNIQPIFPHPVG